jgi:hypothetical protein
MTTHDLLAVVARFLHGDRSAVAPLADAYEEVGGDRTAARLRAFAADGPPRVLLPLECEADGCAAPAERLVYSRDRREVAACCRRHADAVVDERNPEYDEVCANCGCLLPIN